MSEHKKKPMVLEVLQRCPHHLILQSGNDTRLVLKASSRLWNRSGRGRIWIANCWSDGLKIWVFVQNGCRRFSNKPHLWFRQLFRCITQPVFDSAIFAHHCLKNLQQEQQSIATAFPQHKRKNNNWLNCSYVHCYSPTMHLFCFQSRTVCLNLTWNVT